MLTLFLTYTTWLWHAACELTSVAMDQLDRVPWHSLNRTPLSARAALPVLVYGVLEAILLTRSLRADRDMWIEFARMWIGLMAELRHRIRMVLCWWWFVRNLKSLGLKSAWRTHLLELKLGRRVDDLPRLSTEVVALCMAVKGASAMLSKARDNETAAWQRAIASGALSAGDVDELRRATLPVVTAWRKILRLPNLQPEAVAACLQKRLQHDATMAAENRPTMSTFKRRLFEGVCDTVQWRRSNRFAINGHIDVTLGFFQQSCIASLCAITWIFLGLPLRWAAVPSLLWAVLNLLRPILLRLGVFGSSADELSEPLIAAIDDIGSSALAREGCADVIFEMYRVAGAEETYARFESYLEFAILAALLARKALNEELRKLRRDKRKAGSLRRSN